VDTRFRRNNRIGLKPATANRRFGWYADDRFRHALGRQFRRHVGRHSYWLLRSAEEAQPWVEQEFRAAVDEIVHDFRPG